MHTAHMENVFFEKQHNKPKKVEKSNKLAAETSLHFEC